MIDNLPATDTGGYAGLADQVDLHTWKLLKGVALATVLGVGSQLAFGSSDSDLIRALRSRRSRPPTAPASDWSSAISMCSRPLPYGPAGRCA